ncbi:hypothetical protein [Burkholderia cepacia]|uniref:hypothetical protein n=1 Tax=Burkholderia cepacia TaxID=292 RepID=UPI0012D9059B
MTRHASRHGSPTLHFHAHSKFLSHQSARYRYLFDIDTTNDATTEKENVHFPPSFEQGAGVHYEPAVSCGDTLGATPVQRAYACENDDMWLNPGS